jgi:hypothetical protein
VVAASGPAQVMVGLMPATLPLTTCAPSHAAAGVHRARTLFLDRRTVLARNRCVLAGQTVEPGPLPERLHDDGQVQPDVPAGPVRPALALARASARAVRGYGRAARPRSSWPCGCPSHRRAPRSHRSGHRGRRRGTRGHRRGTPDTRTPGHRTRGHPDATDTGRSHRTPDAWTLTENADRVTKARQASGHLGHRDEPIARWTPNRVPMGQRTRRSATRTARR